MHLDKILILPVLLLFTFSNAQTFRHQYRFNNYDETSNMVKNDASATGLFDLYYANARSDIAQSKFSVYSDEYFGMQYMGQYSYHQHSNQRFINQPNFYIQFWFWTCETSSFVIFSVQEEEDSNEDDNERSTFLSVGVQGDGYLYIEVRLVDNEKISAPKEKTTNLKISSGWNFVALSFDETYEYSYVNMYLVTQASNTVQRYNTFFEGFYSETFEEDPTSDTNQNVVLILGCKNYYNYNNARSADEVYGLCMKGFIQQFEVHTTSNVGSFLPWNYDDGSGGPTGVTGFVGSVALSGGLLANPNYKRTSTTAISTLILGTPNIQSSQIFVWDAVQNLGAPSFIKSGYTCNIGLSTGASSNPYFQPSIGRITTNATNYMKCTLGKTGSSFQSFIPPSVSFEAWFRLDPLDLRPHGYVSQIFALYDTVAKDYRMGFGMSNTFLRVYIDDTVHDYHYLFNETTRYWHYAAVSYTKVFERETQMKIFIDKTQLLDTKVFDLHNFKAESPGDYELHISKDFPGVVRKAKINARPYCLESTSPWIETDQTKCVKRGQHQCYFCDKDETNGANYNCFHLCDDLGYYIDSLGGCSSCHKSCRYCKESSSASDCYLCNSTALWMTNTEAGNTYTSATDGNRVKCECSAGTITSTDGSCMSCDKRCAVCRNIFNINCDMCADGAYKVYKDECSYKCPPNYIKDDTYHICSYDMNLMQKPQPPEDPQGCMHGYYWNWKRNTCQQCYGDCLTCEGSSSFCTSCPIGKYLTKDNSCKNCETFFKQDMIVGTSSACIETCGDGKNYGLNACDDGNTRAGDGCSADCTIEKNFMCRGGSNAGKDSCYYTPTELISATVNKYNDILIEFSRPVQPISGSIDNQVLQVSYRDTDGNTQLLSYKAHLYNLPANYIYLQMFIDRDIKGGINLDNLITIKYLDYDDRRKLQDFNSQLIVDINGIEVKKGTYARVYLQDYVYFSPDEKAKAEKYGKLLLGLVAGAVSFWLTISIITRKTLWPVFLLIFFMQQYFYASIQDVFYDHKARYYFTFFRIFRFEHPKIHNMFRDGGIIDLTQLMKIVYNRNMYLLGELEFHNFHINNNFKIWFVIAFFALIPLITLADFIMRQCNLTKNKYYEWFHTALATKFFFSAPLMLLFLIVYQMGLSVFLEVIRVNLHNDFQIYSFAMCVIISIIIIMYGFVMWLITLMHWKFAKDPHLVEKYNLIFKSFRDSVFQLVYVPLMNTKRIASFLVMAVLAQYTIGPVILQGFLSGLIVFYLLLFRPFKNFVNNLTSFILELTLVGCQFVLLGYTDRLSERNNIFWIMIGIPLGGVLLAIIVLLILGWFKMSEYFFFRRYGVKKPKTRFFKFRYTAYEKAKTNPMFDLPADITESDFDLTKLENDLVDSQENIETMKEGSERKMFNNSNAPLFAYASDVKKISHNKDFLKSKQLANKKKKPLDAEKKYDKTMPEFQKPEEIKKENQDDTANAGFDSGRKESSQGGGLEGGNQTMRSNLPQFVSSSPRRDDPFTNTGNMSMRVNPLNQSLQKPLSPKQHRLQESLDEGNIDRDFL